MVGNIHFMCCQICGIYRRSSACTKRGKKRTRYTCAHCRRRKRGIPERSIMSLADGQQSIDLGFAEVKS